MSYEYADSKKRAALANAAKMTKLSTARKNYAKRFIIALSNALTENFELVEVNVDSGAYRMYDRDNYAHYTIYNAFGSAGQSDWSLTTLEEVVLQKRIKRENIELDFARKMAALSKLTAEERELLGL